MEKSKQIVSPRNPFNWMPEIELKELGVCKHPKPADKTSIGYDLYVPRGIFIEPHSRTIVPTNVSLNLPLCVEAKVEQEAASPLKVWRAMVLERCGSVFSASYLGVSRRLALCASMPTLLTAR